MSMMRWIREFTLKERKKTAELTELFGLKTVSLVTRKIYVY